MEMLSGSQINSFLSATSLVWSSSIVLLMIGLVYFFKYMGRDDSLIKSPFFILYMFTVILNLLEYALNFVMQKNPPYEFLTYRFYILMGFFWNIAILYYIISYLFPEELSKKLYLKIIYFVLVLASILCCVFLDIDSALENSGKFYVLTGSLNSTYNIVAIVSNVILLGLIFIYRKRMPKGFYSLCIITFMVYVMFFIFEHATDYTVKETVFVYSILVLVLFNTTSNQDKETVNKLNASTNALNSVYEKNNKLANKVAQQLRDPLNDFVLYNDELYLSKDYDKESIKNNSKEIENIVIDLSEYLSSVKDISMIESNSKISNYNYTLNYLTNSINKKILPLVKSKKVNFSMNVLDKTFLNYIGDINKIEKAIINILSNAINNTSEGQNVELIISSSQADLKNVELSFMIKNSGNDTNIDLALLNVNDSVENNTKYDKYTLGMIVSNRILEILNTKMDLKVDDNSTIYSFSVMQGFKDREFYKI